jgi:hypothetical protein
MKTALLLISAFAILSASCRKTYIIKSPTVDTVYTDSSYQLIETVYSGIMVREYRGRASYPPLDTFALTMTSVTNYWDSTINFTDNKFFWGVFALNESGIYTSECLFQLSKDSLYAYHEQHGKQEQSKYHFYGARVD